MTDLAQDGATAAAGVPVDGLGCHAGAEMEAAARAAGNSDLLDGFARDYPQGPA